MSSELSEFVVKVLILSNYMRHLHHYSDYFSSAISCQAILPLVGAARFGVA